MSEAILLHNGKEVRRVQFQPPCALSQLVQTAQPCAGKGTCGQCRVQARGNLSRLTNAEREHLSPQALSAGYRLACQAKATGNVRITIPENKTAVKADSAPVDAVQPLGSEYGLVLDLGTTTIGGALYHLPTGKLCAQAAAANPQAIYGADVLSRIDAAGHGELQMLSTRAQHALFDLSASLIMQEKIAPNNVDAAVLVGNTVMLHLLFGLDPAPLGVSPFRCDTRFGDFYPADFLPVRRGTKVYIPRCISAFLGADTTAAVLASRLADNNKTALLADLGTNGEIVLSADGALYGCSCAAGPAFEGVGLSCGMSAVEGAIHTVMLSGGQYIYRTVGNGKPTGFCGSGLFDLIACMLRTGELSHDGKIKNGDRFYLADTPLYITQKDIRAFQIAKSAVRCGLEILLQKTSTRVQSLSLAGSFGSELHLPSANAVGLFPQALQKAVHPIGNAAVTGGAMLLLDNKLIAQSSALSDRIETVQLAQTPDFNDMLCRYTELQ